ncbi:extracellular solute-binding protein [Streptomyces scopuliridis]|uniref:Extracellular solute-binding protein n=1 Tax=Streptomyces scopuliridis TaxID=452529 RepID=A0ACD4ZUP2_9ACTN|nr:extracellular solute-binding protein [Streptomyces scopuliridis]WSB37736.1 extracellular solute-binding protein [Streptomyces scopuliridis]WSC02190.1 extracellular solute-binding protein [Streptomyces scopuliridis]WSC04273.1 extracellular solute-binding protein [Streptomyces scopuliridis]
MKNRPLVCSVALVSSVALGGCGVLPGGDDSVTVTVWLMKDSVSDDFLKRFVSDYEKGHPSVQLDVKIQEWTGIGEKVLTALDGEDTPDVIEVGNTQVAQYAESGNLRDLTLESVRDLGSEDWLPGLAQPGSIDGAQFGIPWYAANRVVIYNKDLFALAGIEEPPKTRAQWLDDTAELNRGGNQGVYLAGQDWYTLAGFIWDEGGELAVESGGEWQGTIHTPAALRGMDFYKDLQSLGNGPKNSDEAKPPQAEVFAQGDVAQIISTPSSARIIEEKNPELKGKLGFFPIPGKTADKPGAVFTGGSDLIVPKNSSHHSAAVEVVKALAGETWQTDLARTMSYVPNKTTLAGVIRGDASTAAMAEGAARGRATPNSPQWASVEADNPIKPYMTAVLEGKDPAESAKAASELITAELLSG